MNTTEVTFNPLWTEKYRPQRISDVIIPESIKTTFQNFVNKKLVPNLILTGGPGVGKTTIAKAVLKEIGADYIEINGSLKGNIDTLRDEILQYVSTVSFSGARKYVILDESDYLNPNSTQPALRNFMEEFSSNAGFILTCNYLSRIIEPLQSRCSVINFNFDREENKKLANLFYKSVCDILDKESIQYDKKVVTEFIRRYYPDWRRILNELQRLSFNGKIDSYALVDHKESSIKTLLGFMKQKDFTSVRKWVAETDIEPHVAFRALYDVANEYFKPNFIPMLVVILAKYGYQSALVVDKDINTAAALVEIMVEAEFK